MKQIPPPPYHVLPWRLSRAECILKVLKKRNLCDVADIGVQDMFYTKRIKTFVNGTVYAVDLFFSEQETIKENIVCLNTIEKLPDNGLDCAVMMDVLEHIKDDKGFFNKVVDKVRVGGTILITVPAWQFLFSEIDTMSQHYRRYNRKSLLALLKNDVITVERCYYFYTGLFLVRLVNILNKKKFGGDSFDWKYPEKNTFTVLIKIILNIDFMFNKVLDKIGIHLPGLSLVAICKKEWRV